jgi:cell shape-determining protein MreC
MSIISLILIILVHYLFTFFKTNLTQPKIKDLVNKPQQQYQQLFDTMKETSIKSSENDSSEIMKNKSSENMKNELKNYLKELSGKKNDSHVKTNVNQLDGLMTADNMGSSSYSSF